MKKQSSFRKLISILVVINLIGCSTLQPIEAQPKELHDRIRHEHIVKVGDRVRIITEDAKEHQFQVTSIDANQISGESVTIPIESIVALETREISIGKTTLLAGGTIGIVFLLFLVIIAPIIFFAPG